MSKTQDEQKNYHKPKQLPWIIPIFCDGCASCVNQCLTGGLKMTDTNRPGVYVPWLSNVYDCVGCGHCAKNCAMGAISMTKFVDMAIERFDGKSPQLPD